MTDRLIFAAFVIGVLILPWRQGDTVERAAWDGPSCTFLAGDWPATYEEQCDD